MGEGIPPPVEPGTMKGPRKLDATGDGSWVGSGDTTAGAELAGTMISGALLEGPAVGDAGGTVDEVGTMRGGSTPVLPRIGRFPRGPRAGLEDDCTGAASGDSLSGACGRGVNAGDEVPSDVRPVEPLAGLEGGCGRCSTGSGEAGAGDGR